MHDPETDARLNPILVSATHAWASGQPFSAIVNLTEVAEGHLLRALRRLDELLRHVGSACRGLGDLALATRINDARATVHRDMVCAPSLYVAEELPGREGGGDGDDGDGQGGVVEETGEE